MPDVAGFDVSYRTDIAARQQRHQPQPPVTDRMAKQKKRQMYDKMIFEKLYALLFGADREAWQEADEAGRQAMLEESGLAELSAASASLSITSLDRSLARALEPRASQPEQRLHAIKGARHPQPCVAT